MNPYQPGEDNQDPYEVGYKAGAASRDAEVVSLTNQRDYEYVRAEQLAQKNAEITECDALRDRMSEILSATAIAINGSEPELTKWSWHDLSEKAGALKQQVAELVAALEAMLTHMGMDEDEWNKPTFNQARAALAKVRKP